MTTHRLLGLLFFCLPALAAFPSRETKVDRNLFLQRTLRSMPRARPAEITPPTRKLRIRLSTQEKLFALFGYFPEEAGLPSTGLGAEPIPWETATGPTLTLEQSLPAGTYTLMLMDRGDEKTHALHLWVRQHVQLKDDLLFQVSGRDLNQGHSIRVRDPKGAISRKAPGMFWIQTPAMGDGWSHGLGANLDSSYALQSNALPLSWSVYFNAQWLDEEKNAVFAFEPVDFTDAHAALELGEKGYTPFAFTLNLPGPARNFLRCADFSINLPSGLWIEVNKALQSDRILLSSSKLSVIGLNLIYTRDPFTPEKPDFACFADVWAHRYLSTQIRFTEQGKAVLLSQKKKPFLELPQPAPLGTAAATLVGDDTLGYYQHKDDPIYSQFFLSEVAHALGESGMEKVSFSLKQGDQVIDQGESSEGTSGKWWIGHWLGAGHYRLQRSFHASDENAPSVDSFAQFEIRAGGVKANKRKLPCLAHFNWLRTDENVFFYVEPYLEEDGSASVKDVTLQIRKSGAKDWIPVALTPLRDSPEVYAGGLGLPETGPYEIRLDLRNVFSDERTYQMSEVSLY